MNRAKMRVNDRVVAIKDITLVGGDILHPIIARVIKIGTKGTVVCVPPDPTCPHVLFDGDDTPCGLSLKNIRLKQTPPSLIEKLRLLFA
jgi:hypothetical protein